MGFGEANQARMGECTKDTAFEILDHFVEQGGNFIDTANSYQNEQSEVWLGEWIASRKNRDELVLATKYSSSYKGWDKSKIQSNYGGNGAKSLRVSLDLSLQKLQTSYIDLFYLHWWDYTVSIPELMLTLNDAVASGKVLYLGISDTPAWVVSQANQYARDHGLRQFTVYQGLWNASIRDFERDIIPMVHNQGMGLCPWGALGQGRFQTEEAFKEREANNPGRKAPVKGLDRKVSRALEIVATRKSTNITSVALAYVMQKAPYVFPIVGCRTLEHLKGNIKALSISLDRDDIAEIENGYDFDPGFPHTFLSGTSFGDGPPKAPEGPADIWLTKLMGNFDWVGREQPVGAVSA
jgi:aryl-alcohol dehydrogenase-like predicted oxidoreductase